MERSVPEPGGCCDVLHKPVSYNDLHGTTTGRVKTRGWDQAAWCWAGAATPEPESKQDHWRLARPGSGGLFIISIHRFAPAQSEEPNLPAL